MKAYSRILAGIAKVQLIGAGALGLYGFLAMLITIQLVCSG